MFNGLGFRVGLAVYPYKTSITQTPRFVGSDVSKHIKKTLEASNLGGLKPELLKPDSLEL